MISQTQPLKIKSFLPFNFAITTISVAIRLAEDGTRMGGLLSRPEGDVTMRNFFEVIMK